MSAGILFGILAALFQSISYLCTRLFVERHRNDIGTLLALSHIIMGIISVPLVFFLLPQNMPELPGYLPSLLGCTGFYLLGQIFLFSALIKSEASRVSPLLGIKVIILALISFIFLHQHLSLAQWVAVVLCSCSVFLLSTSGKKLHRSSLILIVLACFSYCISDINIKILVDHFKHLGIFHGAVFSAALCYILCGFAGVIFLFAKPHNTTRDTWLYSLPFAFSWLIAMIFLFSCFALIGVVFGNILQSTRGVISIVLGYVIAHLGFEGLEAKITRSVLVSRILAAFLMTVSIALFYYSK
ncbi:MAG: DMT family transporter [Planctomycetes bacterium]|nr:DMT family transporter [Planctomycetota bacterium]